MPLIKEYYLRVKYKDGQEDVISSEIPELDGVRMNSAIMNKKVTVGKYSGRIVGMAESEKTLVLKLGPLHGGVITTKPLLEKRAIKANTLLKNFISTAKEQEKKQHKEEKKRTKDAIMTKKKDIQRDTGNKTREKHNKVQDLMKKAEDTEKNQQPLTIQDLKNMLEQRDKEIFDLRTASQAIAETEPNQCKENAEHQPEDTDDEHQAEEDVDRQPADNVDEGEDNSSGEDDEREKQSDSDQGGRGYEANSSDDEDYTIGVPMSRKNTIESSDEDENLSEDDGEKVPMDDNPQSSLDTRDLSSVEQMFFDKPETQFKEVSKVILENSKKHYKYANGNVLLSKVMVKGVKRLIATPREASNKILESILKPEALALCTVNGSNKSIKGKGSHMKNRVKLSEHCLSTVHEIVQEIKVAAMKKNITKTAHAAVLIKLAEEEGVPAPPLPTDSKKGKGKPRKYHGPTEDGRKTTIKFVEDWQTLDCSYASVRRYIIQKLTYIKSRQKKNQQ